MSKKKVLSILAITILLGICLLNSTVFATNMVTIDVSNSSPAITNTGASSITITSGNGNKANNVVNNATVTNTSVNNLLSSNTNVAKNSVSSYNNVANKSNTATGLPYTGSDSSIVFIVVALVGSAIYAYKKIRDYNV